MPGIAGAGETDGDRGAVRTRLIQVDANRPDPAALAEAARVLNGGGLVAFATETVYGLGGIATRADSVARIFAAKGRPAINPLIVHVASAEQARQCAGHWPERARRLASSFWPGPLTIIVPRSSQIPDSVTASKPTVALRVPAGRVALGLIEHVGLPLAAPSANRSNRLSPSRAAHVLADLEGRIDLILDSGPTELGLESTVIDLTGEFPTLLRPGPIAVAEIEHALGGTPIVELTPGESSDRPSSPGQMPVHYAPRTRAVRTESMREHFLEAAPERKAVLILGEHAGPPPLAQVLFRLDTPESAAHQLYEVLHRCDALEVELIVVVMPPDRPEWRAIRDRLIRATRPLAPGESLK
jgi:L-threonylcarbamoyladenylate synthase